MTDESLFEKEIAWTPTPEVIERAELTRFMRQVGVSTWEKLYRHSIADVEKFTAEVLRFLDISFDPPFEKLLDASNGPELPAWFSLGPDSNGNAAGLNITEVCLDRWQTDAMAEKPAVIWEGEDGRTETASYRELFEEVEEVSEALRVLGFQKGDAIGIHLPMLLETVIALLAINRIGAIAVPVFSGYGVEAIAARLNAVGAKALFTCEGFTRRDKLFDAFGVVLEAVKSCPSVERLLVVERMVGEDWTPDERVKNYDRALFYHELIDLAYESPDDDWLPEPTSAEDPLIILYTSGTTGQPKGIAHTHASFPIKAAQDMAFGTDVGRQTRICWYTDLGWMMGPWLIYGALINGAAICLYDGAPDYPTADRMWEFCASHKVEVLGISPTLVRSLAAQENDADEDGPHSRNDLSSLRILASTGEPWNPGPWRWLFEKVGDSKLPIINYSGGTEIAGGILMGNPLLPIKPCSFSAPCPGMDVDILDADGKPVAPGEVGELVIKQPWVGMARGFWQDEERYLNTYWKRFPGIWVHGDWAMRDEDGFWYILGRSDDTLKVAGKRVGPAEVEGILVSHEMVVEAAVIGVPDDMKGTAMVAFCVLNKNADGAGGELESDLRSLVAREIGKPLTPSRIHFVPALPKTRNAKVMRRVIRAAYLGEDSGDTSSLEDASSVEAFNKLNDR